jgi:hypothetical protein
MDARYDIFELPPGQFPQWLDSATELSGAREKMAALPTVAPGGQYLIRDSCSGAVVDYTVSANPLTA